MSANAMWWVRYTDKRHPELGQRLLSLSSPDLSNPTEARRRAARTARERLARKGCKPVILSVRCVG